MTYVDSEILFDLTLDQQKKYLENAGVVKFLELTYETGEEFDWQIGTRDTADYYELFFLTENENGLNIEEDVYYYDYNLFEKVVSIIEDHGIENEEPITFAVADLDLDFIGDQIIEPVIDNIVNSEGFIKIKHLPKIISTDGYEKE